MRVSKPRSLRWVALVSGVLNFVVVILGGFLMIMALTDCGRGKFIPFAIVSVAAGLRIMSMIGTGISQEATATTILSCPAESSFADAVIRHERRMRYKKWLWWTRFAMVVTVLQFVGGTYMVATVAEYISQNGKSSDCLLDPNGNGWKQNILLFFLILVWFLIVLQCLTGSDVLRWRSFYATHDNAWKAHYREVFDHGIREALCCLGRVKYLSVMEEDEVYSVARLLGDLVAYRASGTGHLELLAGLALLQRHSQSTKSYEGHMEAPDECIQAAAAFHQFAEAAYTGPLLDFGRNPILFPCAWLYRQEILTPWTRNRRPVLEGDNWWRGHAAAFLNYVNLSPEALRQGRVSQEKREAAYFIVVLHHLRSVVIAVRGTETPEDIITDGLCRECTLSVDDLDALIKKENVISSFPHYGHSGIVEAARELFMQVDGQPGDKDNSSESTGFLSSLLGAGCECEGYNIRIVGHSLGGAVGALLGLRLYRRYPNLHVYSYGTPPCVDSVIAEACSNFVTSIIYNDEFSARLSVSSILRLRAAAIMALSQDHAADSAMICRLARRFLHVSKYLGTGVKKNAPASSLHSGTVSTEDRNNHICRAKYKYDIKGGSFLCAHVISCLLKMPNHHRCRLVKDEDCKLSVAVSLVPEGAFDKKGSAFTAGSGEQVQQFSLGSEIDITENPQATILRESYDELGHHCDTQNTCTNPCFETAADVISTEDPVSQFMNVVPSSNEMSINDPQEVFLPGLVIHIVPQKRNRLPLLWKGWRAQEREHNYRAYIANRQSFKDIIVSPSMFLDHLPWRCHYAMQKILETRKAQGQLGESQMV